MFTALLFLSLDRSLDLSLDLEVEEDRPIEGQKVGGMGEAGLAGATSSPFVSKQGEGTVSLVNLSEERDLCFKVLRRCPGPNSSMSQLSISISQHFP